MNTNQSLWFRIKKNPNTSMMMFASPFLLMFLVFFVGPFLVGVFMSFTNTKGFTNNYKFVGLDNYITVLTDKNFYTSLWLTVLFSFISVAIGNVLAIVLAFVIESGVKFKSFFRTAYFIPYVFALVIIGFTWRIMFTQVLPSLANATGWSFLKLGWISDPKIAIFSVIFVQIWYNMGYYLAIYIAGIQAIDTSLTEAAHVDGAKTWDLYTKIMVPLMIPSISVCVFTGFAATFKVFDVVLALTGGGPGYATEVLALNIYNTAMGESQKYGLGMAKAMILALIILLITVAQLRYFKSKEVEV